MKRMKPILCITTILATSITGGLSFPAEQSSLESENERKQDTEKRTFSLFDIGFNVTGGGVPIPANLNFSTNFANGVGGSTSFVMPLILPFPMGLFMTAPALSVGLGVNTSKNVGIAVNAGVNPESGSAIPVPTPQESDELIVDAVVGSDVPPNGSSEGPVIEKSGNGAGQGNKKSRPYVLSKPALSVAEAMQMSATPVEHQTGNVAFESNSVENLIISLSPNEIQQVPPVPDVNYSQDHGVNSRPESVPVEKPEPVAPFESSAVQKPQTQLLSDNIYGGVAVLDNRVPGLVGSFSESREDPVVNSGKSRRHAGVIPDLRTDSVEDVKSGETSAPVPFSLEHVNSGMSKEEMILLAMEQAHQMVPEIQQHSAGRPAYSEGPYQHDAAPQIVNPALTANLRNPEQQSLADAIPHKANADLGKHKSRPYGMDAAKNKPSRPRPTLDGAMKDKVQHFGLPHHNPSDFAQKEVESVGPTVFGWQLPSIKWPFFNNLLQFLGSRHKSALDKSDEESCVDDDETADLVRSPASGRGGALCGAAQTNCNEICVGQGYSGGSCLGPQSTPGCLCRLPNNKEYGLMLSVLKTKPVEGPRESDLQTSDTEPCRKCACAEACKQSGSYAGFCANDCICSVPWQINSN